jgi:hypothetical protein
MLTCFTALLQVSWVSAVGDLVLPDDKVDLNTLSREQVSEYSYMHSCVFEGIVHDFIGCMHTRETREVL